MVPLPTAPVAEAEAVAGVERPALLIRVVQEHPAKEEAARLGCLPVRLFSVAAAAAAGRVRRMHLVARALTDARPQFEAPAKLLEAAAAAVARVLMRVTAAVRAVAVTAVRDRAHRRANLD